MGFIQRKQQRKRGMEYLYCDLLIYISIEPLRYRLCTLKGKDIIGKVYACQSAIPSRN